MEKFFEITAKCLSEFLQTKYIAFFQLNEPKDALIPKYVLGFDPKSLDNLRQIRPTIGIFQRLLGEKTFQIENEIFPHEKKLAFLLRLDGLESMMGVPIFSKGNVWGVLAVFSQESYNFKKEDGEVLSRWGAYIGGLQDFLSSHLQIKSDTSLAQILGNIELLKLRLRNEECLQVSDIMDALDHLKDAILKSSQNLRSFCDRPILEKKPEEADEELLAEEVITVEGEKKPLTVKRKVLIVDDQPIITDLLVDILRRMGYSSQVALGGKDGLKMFAKDDFDLVITDLGMPDISGWEVSRSVKEQNPSVPVILITGFGVKPDHRKMKDSGVDFVINKPFQIDQLDKIIKQLINPKRDDIPS
jgi:CheY-like chemotaxis protein